MSFPGAVVPIAVASGVQSSFDILLASINTNPYFIGIMMIFLNLGGRFLGLEMSSKQEKFFQHPYVRRLLIFTVLFVATRNIWVAFWMTILVVLFVGYIFNENSALCIFNINGAAGSTCGKEGFQSGLSPLEEEMFQKLAQKRGIRSEPPEATTGTSNHIKNYYDNMKKIVMG